MLNGEGCAVQGDTPPVDRVSSDVPYVDQGFVEFYRSEYRKVVALGIALTGSLELGEEIAQEAFLAAHRKWARVSGYDRPATVEGVRIFLEQARQRGWTSFQPFRTKA